MCHDVCYHGHLLKQSNEWHASTSIVKLDSLRTYLYDAVIIDCGCTLLDSEAPP